MWFIEDKIFDPEEHSYQNYAGFVYVITDLSNQKKYIGKKLFWKIEKKRPLKGRVNKRHIKKDSDWKDYFGSSETVQMLVEQHGPERFKREIIRLCKTKGEMTYFEMKEQIDKKVLFDDKYYNEFIGGKIHSKHLKGIENA